MVMATGPMEPESGDGGESWPALPPQELPRTWQPLLGRPALAE